MKMVAVVTDRFFCVSNRNRVLKLLIFDRTFLVNLIKCLNRKDVRHEELYRDVI